MKQIKKQINNKKKKQVNYCPKLSGQNYELLFCFYVFYNCFIEKWTNK